MTRYFMHLRDGTETILDPEGLEFASMDALRKAVLLSARDLMKGDVDQGLLDLRFRIDAEDSAGAIVYTLAFKHAVDIIPDTAPSASPRSCYMEPSGEPRSAHA